MQRLPDEDIQEWFGNLIEELLQQRAESRQGDTALKGAAAMLSFIRKGHAISIGQASLEAVKAAPVLPPRYDEQLPTSQEMRLRQSDPLLPLLPRKKP